jgi:RNA polymerase primary sigma factor
MTVLTMSHAGSLGTRGRLGCDQGTRRFECEGAGPGVSEQPIEGAARSQPAGSGQFARLRISESKSQRSGRADIERARRILGKKLTYIAHPSFDVPSARDAILVPSPVFETPGLSPAPVYRGAGEDSAREIPIPSRELETHLFCKFNCLKCLACRIRDRVDPDSPVPVDLDEIERLQIEALKLKNQIIETHLRLVVSVARKFDRAGYDLPERISDGTFALMRAVDRFNFALGNRFSTYATWAIINALVGRDRKERRRRAESFALYRCSIALPSSFSDEQDHEADQNRRAALVERWLDRLDKRERRILARRYGIGGGPEQTLRQIGVELGISKERVRQLANRAAAKFLRFARLEGLEPSEI